MKVVVETQESPAPLFKRGRQGDVLPGHFPVS